MPRSRPPSALERAAAHLCTIRLLAQDPPQGAFHGQPNGGHIHTVDLPSYISTLLLDLLKAGASPEAIGTSAQELRGFLLARERPVPASTKTRPRRKTRASIIPLPTVLPTVGANQNVA